MRCEACVAAQSTHPSRREKTFFPGPGPPVHPQNPPNIRRDPKCYTGSGIDTSPTRVGSRGRQKVCVRSFGVLWLLVAVKLQDTIGWSSRSGLHNTLLSAEKKTTRVESDAGRARCKLQENAYEGVIGASCARQPPLTRCGERVTMLTLHCQRPSCHHCPLS